MQLTLMTHAGPLVVADAPEICELAQAVLEAAGFRVLTVAVRAGVGSS